MILRAFKHLHQYVHMVGHHFVLQYLHQGIFIPEIMDFSGYDFSQWRLGDFGTTGISGSDSGIALHFAETLAPLVLFQYYMINERGEVIVIPIPAVESVLLSLGHFAGLFTFGIEFIICEQFMPLPETERFRPHSFHCHMQPSFRKYSDYPPFLQNKSPFSFQAGVLLPPL